MFTRILAFSLLCLGCAAAQQTQQSNAVQAFVLAPQSVAPQPGRGGSVDLSFGLQPLVHGPYTLYVLSTDGDPGTILLNGAPVLENSGKGSLQTVTVSLQSADTLSVQLHGRPEGIVVAIAGWEYAFAGDYANIPVEAVSPSGSGTLDWRAKGAVTPVKNQGACPASWAFSATGVVEGFNMVRNGRLTNLAEQELLDCSGASSCLMGDTAQALDWVGANGITQESAYPYTARQGTCRSGSVTPVTQIEGLQRGPIGDEETLGAMVDQGPVSVVINSSWFGSYTHGVASPACESQIPSYASVLIVGYGHDAASGLDYWLVKNSLGTTWGEVGYFRIVRGQNTCGIADYAVSVY